MVKKIIFGTTNAGKLAEAQSVLGMKVEGVSLDIDEVQSPDTAYVATKKAQDYWKKIKKPLFVEDLGLTFKAFKNLPGVYIRDFLENLGNEGLIKIIPKGKSREATAVTVLAYYAGRGEPKLFKGEVKGTIAQKTKGDKGFGWDPIFIPKGSKKTFGQMEMEEKNKYSMRRKALEKLHKWLKEKKM
ncbi:non-canonical purine NTP pyrophosphatase, RdgB/HAM1 family [Candidatus Woesebacteria bacterium RIFCSPHIGHO2_01_FULL_44_21]|uniref:Non-canonical purine NTP pyrophosphatase, RdgB/HAM1 family n=1 Tax=Candidatus Woesebacteria bacterium RIFCSPHIGHO2_01_FULL_44_21 TaxID=1802503 RepID=A0A1F7Z214_9BACT|nr:MAG: non-canonical purine NTP pyrophosphatase, RdgB/HAM1 family [Candidatus Woesebacteria bacterium RIFCSPHIGHO2_01_FULL_44_21]OGM69486.1 MAG: non-canonical purine NTP pyrophosphatase, RdgB/HAM1 family [Candidatus Woesebacteria bacterium RIFCSPLOWO2_01_FULL_44_24b]